MILLIAGTTVVAVVLSAAISIWLESVTRLRVPTIGTIRTSGVEAYWNKELTNRTESVNWGTISPGASQNISIHLRSISNTEASLNLTSENWTFWKSSSDIAAGPMSTTPYMNLTWNYDNTIVKPGEVLQVTLTLSVDGSSDFVEFLIANDVRTFSLDIVISTSEYS